MAQHTPLLTSKTSHNVQYHLCFWCVFRCRCEITIGKLAFLSLLIYSDKYELWYVQSFNMKLFPQGKSVVVFFWGTSVLYIFTQVSSAVFSCSNCTRRREFPLLYATTWMTSIYVPAYVFCKMFRVTFESAFDANELINTFKTIFVLENIINKKNCNYDQTGLISKKVLAEMRIFLDKNLRIFLDINPKYIVSKTMF